MSFNTQFSKFDMIQQPFSLEQDASFDSLSEQYQQPNIDRYVITGNDQTVSKFATHELSEESFKPVLLLFRLGSNVSNSKRYNELDLLLKYFRVKDGPNDQISTCLVACEHLLRGLSLMDSNWEDAERHFKVAESNLKDLKSNKPPGFLLRMKLVCEAFVHGFAANKHYFLNVSDQKALEIALCFFPLRFDAHSRLELAEHQLKFLNSSSSNALHYSSAVLLMTQDVRSRIQQHPLIWLSKIEQFMPKLESVTAVEYRIRSALLRTRLVDSMSKEDRIQELTDLSESNILEETQPKHLWLKSDLMCELGELTHKMCWFDRAAIQLDKCKQLTNEMSRSPTTLFRAAMLLRRSILAQNTAESKEILGQAVAILEPLREFWPTIFARYSAIVWFPSILTFIRLIFDIQSLPLPESLCSCLSSPTVTLLTLDDIKD